MSTTFNLFGGVFNLPNASSDHYANDPYNEVTQPSADLLYELVTTTIDSFKWGPVDNAMADARKHDTRFIWYCGYLNWASGQGFPANYGYNGAEIQTLLDNLMGQAKDRYGESDLNKYCIFNYANETILSYAGTGNWEQGFGGKGSTGCDWVINTGKIVRKHFPNAMIGINEFNVEDVHSMHQYGGGQSRLNDLLAWLPHLRDAGVLDWLGMEGYSLESQTSAGLSEALSKCGEYAPVIYTEFSPGSYDWFSAGEGTVDDPPQADSGGTGYTKVACWKRLVQLLANSGFCYGIVGPWVGTPAGGSAIFSGDPPVDKPAMTWLKSYIPTILNKPPVPPDPGPEPMPPDTLTPGAYTLGAGQYTFNVASSGGESADKTTVPPAADIVDANSDKWTLVSGVVKKNGANAGYTANVVKLAYVSKKVWQTNVAGGWWYWTGSDWKEGANPMR